MALVTEEWYLVCLHNTTGAERLGQEFRGDPRLHPWGASAGNLSHKHIAMKGKIEHVPAVLRQEQGTVVTCGIRQMAQLMSQEG